MPSSIPNIKNDIQDRNSFAWGKLCEYIDKLDEEEGEEFKPIDVLGYDLYQKIYALPESIAKLKKVKTIYLYGSSLRRIPPEIGEMEALETFTVYTSYNLKWVPYEVLNCKSIKRSSVSRRALFGILEVK